MDKFKRLIKNAVNSGVSDVHISGDHPVVCRENGEIVFIDEQYSAQEVDRLAQTLLAPHESVMLTNRLSVDLARTIEHVRIRINMFFSTRGLSMAIRLLPGKIPNFTDLNLFPEFKRYCELNSGLILICGTTGSGKSSTIASILSEINRTRRQHIITLEDPIEYRFDSNKSYIEQRELGVHIHSFEQGLQDVLREDPDVIMLGELREPETIRLTLNAVESGHLVIASLHANNPEDALHRLCNAFPPDAQEVVRTQLASVLSILVVQRLDYFKHLGFRVPVLSILKGTNSVKRMIRENRFSQIHGIMQTSRNKGMFTQETYKSEFILTERHLVPPSVSFKPSMEKNLEQMVTSRLMPEKINEPDRSGSEFNDTHTDNAFAAKRDESGQYIISGSSSIEDVLSQMDNKETKRP